MIVTENGAEVVDGGIASEDDCCWDVFIQFSDISLLANDSMNLRDEALQVEKNVEFGAKDAKGGNAANEVDFGPVNPAWVQGKTKVAGNELLMGSPPDTGSLLKEGLWTMPEDGGEELSVVSHWSRGAINGFRPIETQVRFHVDGSPAVVGCWCIFGTVDGEVQNLLGVERETIVELC